MGVDINFLNLKTKFRISVIEAAVRRKTLRYLFYKYKYEIKLLDYFVALLFFNSIVLLNAINGTIQRD